MGNQKKGTVLVVDDEPAIRASFELILSEDFRVETAASGEAAIQKASNTPVDLVYLDIRMPGIDGMETLRRLKQINKDMEVIMVTAVNDVQSAGEAIQSGARDYIVKPFDVDTVLQKATDLVEKKNRKVETQKIRALGSPLFQKPQILGKGRHAEELRTEVQRAAESLQPVLLMGEAGSEFHEIALLIHVESGRGARPFEVIHFHPHSSQPSLERNLFGHQKGADPTTLHVEPSLFQKTKGGTIFLNHVEHIPTGIQTRLIEMLQEEETPSPVRIIASWVNRMPEEPAENTLHPNLFEVLSAIAIRIPPLSERLADFENIVQELVERSCHFHHKKPKRMAPAALSLLESYPFKGGMTELQGIVENVVLCSSKEQMEAEELPLDIWLHSRTTEKIAYGSFTQKFERMFLERAIHIFGKNILALSKRLGLSPTALQAKLEQYQFQ